MTIRRFWIIYTSFMIAMWLLMFALVVIPDVTQSDAVWRSPVQTEIAIATSYASTSAAIYTPTPNVIRIADTPVYRVSQIVSQQIIDPGMTIESHMVAMHSVPLNMAVSGAYTDQYQVVGRVASRLIVPGQIITAVDLDQPPATPDIYGTVAAQTVTPDISLYYPPATPTALVAMGEVVVPLYDIPAGTIITLDDLGVRELPQSAVTGQMVRSLDEWVDQRTQIDLPREYPLAASALVPAVTDDVFSVPIPDGACVAAADPTLFPAVYPSANASVSAARLRPFTKYRVAAHDPAASRVALTLPSGYVVGWAVTYTLAFSDDCPAY